MKRGMTLNFGWMALLMAVLFSTPAFAQDKPAVASGTSSSTPKYKRNATQYPSPPTVRQGHAKIDGANVIHLEGE